MAAQHREIKIFSPSVVRGKKRKEQPSDEICVPALLENVLMIADAISSLQDATAIS